MVDGSAVISYKNMSQSPKFYLDQNVIDYLLKDKLRVLSELLKKIENPKIVYSYVTLREFSRIKDESQRNIYLNYLKKQKANYFWIDNDEKAHFDDVDPFLKYSENLQNYKMYGNIEKDLLDLMHKFMGGKKNVSFNEIGESQKSSFNYFMDQILETIDSLEEIPNSNSKFVRENINNMKKKYSETIDNSVEKFQSNKLDNVENPVNEFRKLLKIDVSKFKDIEPPNIIEKIWDILKVGIDKNNIKINYDDLFGDEISKFYSNTKVTMIMRINGLYNLLNSLGYYPDANLSDDKKFIPFVNDQHHVGHSIYADYFITRDKKLMKKAEAVFEHFKIGTKIIFIKT